ncbi:MAG: hypothetical protein U1E76_00515 [Planctomycetota bacterium]
MSYATYSSPSGPMVAARTRFAPSAGTSTGGVPASQYQRLAAMFGSAVARQPSPRSFSCKFRIERLAQSDAVRWRVQCDPSHRNKPSLVAA